METRHQRLIREALEHNSGNKIPTEEPEATLRDKSLEHTDPDYVPRTLTPHEWESYYAEHGIPTVHRQKNPAREHSGFGRLLRKLRGAR